MVVVSGFIRKFHKDLKLHHKKSILFAELHRMNVKDLYFALIFGAIIIVIIITVVILEFLIFYKARSVDANKIWTFLDNFICGRRYFFLLEPRNDDVIIPFTN